MIRSLKASSSVLFLLCMVSAANAQFAPVVGIAGSTAISKDSSLFVEWATGCTIQRGYKDIAVPDSGYASVGDGNSAVGVAGQNGVVSLGDGGTATLTFQNPIFNGPGFDFAVFENGFYTQSLLAFLEFAFVEVSSDGNNFFRFSVTSNIQDTSQTPMAGVDCSLVNNLAGKYVFGFGTPFDLEELKNEIGLDVNNITHIRLEDVVGSINETFAAHDQYGHKINDPYPTAFPSGGFDLDAVGVINSATPSSLTKFPVTGLQFTVYPNPVSNADVFLKVGESLIGSEIEVFDAIGDLLSKNRIQTSNFRLPTSGFPTGIYFIKMANHVAKLMLE